MLYFLQQLLNGLHSGALYALLAFGYVLTNGVLRRTNLAYGPVFAFAGQVLILCRRLRLAGAVADACRRPLRSGSWPPSSTPRSCGMVLAQERLPAARRTLTQCHRRCDARCGARPVRTRAHRGRDQGFLAAPMCSSPVDFASADGSG